MSKTINNKKCKQCHKSQPVSEFHKAKATRDGFHAMCKNCRKGMHLSGHLQRYYNLTVEDYNLLRFAQQYKCKICGTHEAQNTYQRLHVDHDHITGKVRGLLCDRCNRGIGCFRDNPDIMYHAIKYILNPYA